MRYSSTKIKVLGAYETVLGFTCLLQYVPRYRTRRAAASHAGSAVSSQLLGSADRVLRMERTALLLSALLGLVACRL